MVIGYSLVPDPPANIIPFIPGALALLTSTRSLVLPQKERHIGGVGKNEFYWFIYVDVIFQLAAQFKVFSSLSPRAVLRCHLEPVEGCRLQ